MSDHDDDASDINNDNAQPQQQQNIQPQIITTVSNNNAKFPYLKKDEYEVWAMKMEYWITNNDMNIWRVIQNGNSLKRTGRDRDGRSIPDDHVADFHYMDDAKDIWNAVKARGIAQRVALTLKIKGGLELLYFDDLYYKLKTLEIDIKGYSTHSSSQSPSHSAFVSTTSTSKKMSYAESPSFSSSTTYSAPSSSKARSHSSGNVLQDVLHSLVAESEPEQQVAYEDFEQIDKLDLEEMDIKWQMAMLSVRVNKFEKKAGRKIEFDKKEAARFNKKAVRCYKCLQKGHFARECRAKGGNEKRYSSFKIQELGKKEADTKALITVDTLENWKEHESGDDEGFAPKEYGMVAGCGAACEEGAAEVYSLITGNGTDAAAGEFALMGMTSEVQNCPFGCEHKFNNLQKQYNDLNEQYNEYYIQVQAYKNSLKTLEKQKRVYQQNQLGYEEKIRVLSIELENTTNLLKHSERINVEAEIAKKDLQTKLDNHLAKTEKWTSSSKNLFRLIDSSMSVRTKVGLGFDKYIGESELGWDDSEFSIFTPKSEEVEGRPLFHKFTKADGMKAVPPPLSGNYIPLSDTTDLDETQMTYGKKSTCSIDSISVSNDFVSCDNSDKSSEIKSNDYAFCVSSVKSSEPMTADSSSNASTSSVSTHASEANLESSEGTTIQEPIIVQELPSFSCTDKDVKTSRTPCNKNGYFNKKASHFRKNNSSASKSCFVCGSYLHLIKDCNYYETQYANDFDGVGYPQREPIWDNATRVTQSNQFVPQAVLLRSGKVSIPAARPNQVPAGRPKPVSTGAPVSTGKQNRPPLVHVGKRNSSSVTSGWWQNAGYEGIVDSGCSRSMTGNKERLDDFQPFKGGKVTFRGGERRITRKGIIRTPKLDFENVYYVKELQQFNLNLMDLVISSPKSSGIRRKSLARSRITKPKSILTELDLDADDKTFIKVVSDKDSKDKAPILWSAFAGWEVISTPLGEINALYMMDQSTKHFTTLREILHMVDSQDLLKLYGLVVKYYENHHVAGARLVLWDVSYPLSMQLMERMLKHKLEIDKDVVGNDMTTDEQLIRFIKNQLAAAQVSPA
ncbi:ribonuclease H-like domain-containing protein [Tanacetum coccineum]|uniref:Ribonuclease H-like domain-containing protein n=1 Tax=Tanacetum coccineum TaxID=301880 RepID=A0ABQ5HTJ1_9ASTR